MKTWCAVGLSVVLGGACGGRAVTIEEGPSLAGGGNVGPTASGGRVSTSGASGRGSGGTGNVGKGGASSAGGATSSGGGYGCSALCPPIACGPGSEVVFPNGACCPSCVSNCSEQPCQAIACPSGYELQTQPGQCCPSCVASPPVDCATGRQQYGSTRMAYAQKYLYGCATAADCVADAEFNACELGCSYFPISLSALGYWQMNLASEAARDCGSCPPPFPLPCIPPLPVYCNSGQCSFDNRP